ncbi:proline dehydrogenase family protein [Deltaproteobacteria bacterium TL4]
MEVLKQPDASHIDNQILELGAKFQSQLSRKFHNLLNKDYWQELLMDWVMKDPDFKIDMFHFIDVLPVLKTNQQMAEHIEEYLLQKQRDLPGVINVGLKAALGGVTGGLATRTVRKNIMDMSERFILSADVPGALSGLRRLHSKRMGFTVDILGEETVSDVETQAYQHKYFELIELLAKESASWREDDLIDRNHLGPIPRANVSLKISALDPFLDSVDNAGAVGRLKEKIIPLLLHAKKHEVFVNFDLEQWEYHNITYDLLEEILAHPELRNWPHLGTVVQAYLTSSRKDLSRLLSLSRSRGTPLTVRLVKGAYWDYERVHAKQHGYVCPVYTSKAETDANYEQLSVMLLEHIEDLFPAFASHNLRSIFHAIVQAREKKIPQNAFEIQVLYGMADEERKTLRTMGNRVRVYTPVGDLLPGMAYLVRRLLENTANSSFLKQRHHDGLNLKTLLVRPNPSPGVGDSSKMIYGDIQSPFANTPQLDFTQPETSPQLQSAIEKLQKMLPYEVPVVIKGEKRFSEDLWAHPSPNKTEWLCSKVSFATFNDVDEAIESAIQAWPEWRDKPLKQRAFLLEKLADKLQEDRFELAALQMFEVGKPWRDADADVVEAIDFCRYYARQALMELKPRKQGDMDGESNILFYEGRGPTAVIAPWNFPLALLCGMSVAALVAGNPVLLKPAEQSSAIAYEFFKRLLAVGFPKEVIHFLPGKGPVIGSYLVEHPEIVQIAFTGSKEVGLSIIKKAGITLENQYQVKKIVCEMGGKNAIIIDDDADLDLAVSGVLQSAFGYAGQKCSACSRVLVVGSAYTDFIYRLIEATRSLIVAPAYEPHCGLGPVVDQESYERLKQIIEKPIHNADLLYSGAFQPGGFFIPATIYAVEDPLHPLMQEELFGPILTVCKTRTFEQALDLANNTEFALTGSVYSRLPSHLKLARRRFRVGNLYLNRGCTGALVDRQPFGGFGMSGIGTKAGGPGYLLNFSDPRCVTENTMRRGFTPELKG